MTDNYNPGELYKRKIKKSKTGCEVQCSYTGISTKARF